MLASEVKVRDCELSVQAANYRASELQRHPVAVVVRLGPLRLDRCPSSVHRQAREFVIAAARRATDTGLVVAELQLDYDAPSRVLPLYARFLKSLRDALAVAGFQAKELTITALPTWLDDEHFGDVVAAVDRYTLQVHALETPKSLEHARTRADTLLFEPAAASIAVIKAGDLGAPFDVALPTYGYELGFRQHRFIGLRADARVSPWPGGTRRLEVAADPLTVAQFAAGLRAKRPANLGSIRWFRLPVGQEALNWDPATFDVVRRGKSVVPQLSINHEEALEGRRIEFFVTNDGNAAARAPGVVQGQAGFAAEGSGGYEAIRTGDVWRFQHSEHHPRPPFIAPGKRLLVGWIIPLISGDRGDD